MRSKKLKESDFAIPINIAKPVIESLEKDGVVKRPALGVGVVSLEDVQPYGKSAESAKRSNKWRCIR